jgi:hypothetical protein
MGRRYEPEVAGQPGVSGSPSDASSESDCVPDGFSHHDDDDE